MTEADYIVVGNLARVRMAISMLSDCRAQSTESVTDIMADEFGVIISGLMDIDRRLYAKCKIDQRDKDSVPAMPPTLHEDI